MAGSRLRLIGVVAMAVLFLVMVVAEVMNRLQIAGVWSPTVRATVDGDVSAASPAALVVEGNQLVTTDGAAVTLRGVGVKDPAVVLKEGSLTTSFFQQIKALGANVVRLPVRPDNWRAEKEYLSRVLDPAVRMASIAGLWVIIDWHVIGDIETDTAGLLIDPGAHASRAETEAFWRTVATHFADTPNVLYELVNEPDGMTARTWIATAQALIDLVRDTGSDRVILIGGIDRALDLSWVPANPLAGGNIAYAVHVPPSAPEVGWDVWFGSVAATQPVLLTAWGFGGSSSNGLGTYQGGDVPTYAAPLRQYVETRHLGWVACWYSAAWSPPMLTWGGEPTDWGAYVLSALSG